MYRTANGVVYGFYTDRRHDPIQCRTVRRLVLLLPGQGCVPWLRTKAGCCPFCRLPAGTRLAVMGEGFDDHYEPWTISQDDYVEMIDTALGGSECIDTIVCFNGGSFLTDREIPRAAREYLYHCVEAHPTAQCLMVESRPEFVRDDMLEEATSRLNGKALTVAIGLESTNDRIRNGPLAKFIGRKSFDSAVARLKKGGHNVFVYVFLGTPDLTEAEAYEDAENSVRELSVMGVDHIALSCAFVPPGGTLEQRFREGTFKPPSLWSIARLVEAAQHNGWPLTLGAFDDFPPPLAIPSNCGLCDDAFHAQFDAFRETNAFDARALPQCSCQSVTPLGKPTESPVFGNHSK